MDKKHLEKKKNRVTCCGKSSQPKLSQMTECVILSVPIKAFSLKTFGLSGALAKVLVV